MKFYINTQRPRNRQIERNMHLIVLEGLKGNDPEIIIMQFVFPKTGKDMLIKKNLENYVFSSYFHVCPEVFVDLGLGKQLIRKKRFHRQA